MVVVNLPISRLLFRQSMQIGEKGGFQFVNEIIGGSIPREFIPSVEKGFEASMDNGVLAGYPFTDLKVRLIDGSFHAVDSDALSFRNLLLRSVTAKHCQNVNRYCWSRS